MMANSTFVRDMASLDNSTNQMDYGPPPEICALYDFLIEAVFMGLLCLFGFCGNSLSMVCLSRDKSKTATPFLLISLEIADTFFLVTVLILRVLTSIHTYTESMPALIKVFPYMAKFVFPCALISETATIYLTILVTVNRYVSVCRPYEASNLCSIHHARKHVVLISLFSILYNIPRFFEFDVYYELDHVKNVTMLVSRNTDMGESKIYQIFYGNILYFLVMFLQPLATLIVLNYKLIVALRKTKKKRAQLLRGNSESAQSRSEDDITLVLIVVVLVFVICQMPALITQVLLTLYDRQTRGCPHPIFFYERISDLLVVANSSLNFLIYCFCSTKFRQILIQLVCGAGEVNSPEASHVGKSGYKQIAVTNVPANAAATAVTNGHSNKQEGSVV